MKKQLLFISIILVMLFAFTGCAGKVKIDKNGIKTSGGELVAGENVKWPDKNMGGLEKPKAQITAILNNNKTGNYTVAFSNMSKEDAVQYIAKLKEQGYKAEMEVNDTDGIIFTGKNASEEMVVFSYNQTAKEGTISHTPKQTSNNTTVESSSASSAAVDMTDVSPWPQNFLSGIPKLKGKIVNVMNQNDEVVSIDMEYVEKADFEVYVNTLKQNGFTVDADETKDSYNYEYKAFNKKGDCISVTMNYEYKKATVYMEKAVTE